jgi:5-oxoprolinase (ATP-hydrolysing) subunit A
MVVYQFGALHAFVLTEGGVIRHLKPHGALYNMAAKNRQLSEAIAEAVYRVDPQCILFGLSGSELVLAGERIGLQTAHEVFADRTYQNDGTLTPRNQPDALLSDDDQAIQQVIRMVQEGKVQSQQGDVISIKADTVCIHGDGPHALVFARRIRESLEELGILVRAVGHK